MIPRFKVIIGGRPPGVAKTATAALGWIMIDGMIHISPHDASPHDKARDQKTREVFLANLPPSWRTPIFVINYTSDSCVNIELKPPVSEEMALAIGKAAEEAFGSEVTLNQWWRTSRTVKAGHGSRETTPTLQNGSGVEAALEAAGVQSEKGCPNDPSRDAQPSG